ncbi:uncharacterized protein PAC_15522 [Phialocephala subalpina]|uniref:Plastocyanin-like domain-containing protein n=1 Tax=Phialocephala subalpina TaxID=576137 RepID=A0A1L7XKQ7_9HELO|nr:uncharacterized protein PAC_15522 [Phialocephala subalpina]
MDALRPNQYIGQEMEPVPYSTLINDQQNTKFNIIPGKRYLFRIINMSGFASNVIKLTAHTMTIVEMDGVATVPKNTTKSMIAAAQGYVVVAQAAANSTNNYGILSTMMPNMFGTDISPSDNRMNATGYLINTSAALPAPPLSGHPNCERELRLRFREWTDERVHERPDFRTAMLAPANYSINSMIYGPATAPVGIVEIYLIDNDNRYHPFHVHYHVAQIVAQGDPGTKLLPKAWNGSYIPIPANGDVFMVNKFSSTVVRFKTGNPGTWLFYCHIEWHIEAGLVMTFIEDPIRMRALNLTIPQNIVNWFDLSEAPTKPPASPWGAYVAIAVPPALVPAHSNSAYAAIKMMLGRMSRVTCVFLSRVSKRIDDCQVTNR